MKIKEIYIQSLKKCYLDFKKCAENINEYEKKIKHYQKELSDWVENNTKLVQELKDKSDYHNDDVNLLEERILEYEKIVSELKTDINPFLLKIESLKKEIENIYTKIMSEYGNKYSEEEIIEYIKTIVNI